MKLVRFGEAGREKPGAIDTAGGIRDISAHVHDIAGEALSPAGIARLAGIDLDSCPLVTADTRLGACVGGVGKFICVGLNYLDHVKEAGAEVPAEPILFSKATSAICGPNDNIVVPPKAHKVDWEVELGIVIGRHGVRVPEADAAAHIAGCCVINDLSERAFQLEGTGQWLKGKSADTFGPVGPWLVTPDEAGDLEQLDLWLRLNGETRQNSNTRQMIFKPAFLVSYISRFMSLHPGDIISTGTPPGVGMGAVPIRYLRPGDTLELGIAGLGTQSQFVVAA